MRTSTAPKKALKLVNLDLSGIVPTEFKVNVRPQIDDGKIKLKSGFELIKPDDVRDRDQHAAMEGVLVSVSPAAFTYADWPEHARKPKTGDTVIFARYAGMIVKGNDGVEYRLMNDKDIVAIREAAR